MREKKSVTFGFVILPWKIFTTEENLSALEREVLTDNDAKEPQSLSVGRHGICRH